MTCDRPRPTPDEIRKSSSDRERGSYAASNAVLQGELRFRNTEKT
ncbi:hypothetical protein SBD_2457 [Streptomyces bottropensis ATCC 25435]|uniref:Uncharacterized protein n=1 Tax=Streptomyces bottropensis ATCC 25435 TaxID=1054862 RepID=M3FSI1_9ACTN|nr:hypothetical protein SBD_2457 [Streptomyces bottropensis ATCC 25435]